MTGCGAAASDRPDDPSRWSASNRARFLEPREVELRSAAYAQAVQVGGLVLASGQGGWGRDGEIPDSLGAEVRQAFDNVAAVLAAAELTWEDVSEAVVYYVGVEVPGLASSELRRRVRTNRPKWLAEPVPMLGPSMHIEVKVVAQSNQADVTSGGGVFRTAVHQGRAEAGDIAGGDAEEVRLALAGVGRELAAKGCGWSAVVGIESWHRRLDEGVFAIMSAQLRELIPTHRPIWTCVGAEPTDVPAGHAVRATVLTPIAAEHFGRTRPSTDESGGEPASQ